jgi:hypothetical protein
MKQLYIPQLETRQAKAEAALETAIDLLANVANLLRQRGNHNGDDARLANSIYAKLGEIEAVRDELNDAIEKREARAIEKERNGEPTNHKVTNQNRKRSKPEPQPTQNGLSFEELVALKLYHKKLIWPRLAAIGILLLLALIAWLGKM